MGHTKKDTMALLWIKSEEIKLIIINSGLVTTEGAQTTTWRLTCVYIRDDNALWNRLNDTKMWHKKKN